MVALCWTAPFAIAKKAKEAPSAQIKDNPASTDMADYIRRVRQLYPTASTNGSIWSSTGRLTVLSADVKAMYPHDLISVVVSENLNASTQGTVKDQRASTANSQLASLFSAFSPSSAAQNILNANAGSSLNAQGQSITNSSLDTIIGGEVVDVLPNGMLVISAARQLEFSQQTETVLLRGLVRPQDVSPSNQVLSTAISGLEVQVVGKGIINDTTHRPNIVVRSLEKILVF
ncbi:MAG TPA: flagellar basal body L-ring protein FlgH [Acidobacteriaceae bacterium]|nr:flagellar basal body L-ring protein FlgH [Acidobacteriaceae bacterium]